MRLGRIGGGAMLAGAGMLAGCGWLPDAYTGCGKERPYHSAQQSAPLKVPAGADAPDTRNALRIPELQAPERPAEPGRCLDHPPPYAASRPAAAAAGDSVAAPESVR